MAIAAKARRVPMSLRALDARARITEGIEAQRMQSVTIAATRRTWPSLAGVAGHRTCRAGLPLRGRRGTWASNPLRNVAAQLDAEPCRVEGSERCELTLTIVAPLVGVMRIPMCCDEAL